MATLEQLRLKIARGEYSGLPQPAAKPQTAPVKKPMSENERQVRQQMADLFNRFDAMKAACAEFGPIDYEACADFAKRGISVEAARREFAGRAAVKNWPALLKAAQGIH